MHLHTLLLTTHTHTQGKRNESTEHYVMKGIVTINYAVGIVVHFKDKSARKVPSNHCHTRPCLLTPCFIIGRRLR